MNPIPRFCHAVKTYVAEHRGWCNAVRDLAAMTSGLLRQKGLAGLFMAVSEYIFFANQPIAFAPSVGRPTSSDSRVLLPVQPHTAAVDIIICVHDALDDVSRCLDSVGQFSSPPFSLIIVDDGSSDATRDFLASFASDNGATLIRNNVARGYTCAANQGLRASTGDYALLLNSDTVVTDGWLDRMVACGESDPAVGLIGPLSNTASWQSVPQVEEGADWATNPLPEGWTIADMGRFIAEFSARTYPRITFLNGFCLMIRREVINAVGYFDEESFGRGYGEENDYCLRARKAGWMLAVADDTYVWHAQSRSYSDDRRRQLSAAAGEILAAKYGLRLIAEGVRFCREDRVLCGIRSRAMHLPEQAGLIAEGRRRWSERTVAFVLPLPDAGGGGNVVISEAAAMARMGVAVTLVNLARCRESFERELPGLMVPVIYASSASEIPDICSGFDAVVATVNFSVEWISLFSEKGATTVKGYYVQDYEPNFYPEGSRQQKSALESYSLIPDMVRLTKTSWNAAAVKEGIGLDCTLVGPSYAGDLFLPRMRSEPSWPDRPLRIAAMIRPASPRRNARFTMEVLREIAGSCGDKVEMVLFGVDPEDSEFLALPRDFMFRNVGRQRPAELAVLFNNSDIFVDFSTYQAMGLTAMEAMACGAAAIVPASGGANSFAIHEKNALLVDTSSREACCQALRRLISNHQLRAGLQREAIFTLPQFFPEGPAFRVLDALFDGAP